LDRIDQCSKLSFQFSNCGKVIASIIQASISDFISKVLITQFLITLMIIPPCVSH